jgi:hypothetical protein
MIIEEWNNQPLISARSIHELIPNEAAFEEWLQLMRENFKPVAGVEYVELSDGPFFSQLFAGVLIAGALAEYPGVLSNARRLIAESVNDLYSHFKRPAEKACNHEQNRADIFNLIKLKKEISRSDIGRGLWRISSIERATILKDLISCGLIAERKVELNSKRRTTIYFLNDEGEG